MGVHHLVYVALLASLVCTATMVDARLLHGPEHRRKLQATSIATAVAAPGSSATSTSQSSGSAVVDTAAIGVQGGHATAQQTADKGNHTLATVSMGDKTTSVEYHSPSKDSKGTPTGKEDKKVTAPANNTTSSPKAAVTWESAHACPYTPTAANSQKDKSGRLWGFHNGASCAFKAPVYDLWASAPSCPSSVSPKSGVKDKSGRLWGYYNGASCAFKDEAPKAKSSGNHSRLLLADDAANNAQLPAVTPVTATTPVPVVLVDPVQPSADAQPATNTANMLNMATNKVAINITKAPSASVDPAATNAAVNTTIATDQDELLPKFPFNSSLDEHNHTEVNRFGVTFEAAPACVDLPNKRNSVQDTLGRLWWYEDGRSCAYRAANGSAIYFTGYQQVKWETSPACTDVPTLVNSMSDAQGRLWGWNDTADGANCKFVDTAGHPAMHQGLLDTVEKLAVNNSRV